MKTLTVLILFFVLLIGFSSCNKVTKVDLINQLRDAKDYSETMKEWTKSAKHYYFSEVEFFVTSTYKSMPLRLAYLKRYSEKFKISKEEQQKMYESEAKDYGNFNDFFITVFSSKKDINNIKDKDKWRLYLELGGASHGKLIPEEIKEIESDSILTYFYPQVTPWTSNFLVRFSRILSDSSEPKKITDDFETMNLLLATTGGEETFTWGVTKEKETN